MYDSFEYLDTKHTYIDPESGILKNLLNISDADVLHFVESGAVTKRLQELSEKPLKITGISSLFEIHKYLFQDIYSWAGNKRTVEISKDGKQFFPTYYFENAYVYINQLIQEFKTISVDNKIEIAAKLAEIPDNINYLHPFREGNGRAQREFIRILAAEKRLTINLNPPDNKAVYDKYMKGTVESNIDILSELFLELIDHQNRSNGV